MPRNFCCFESNLYWMHSFTLRMLIWNFVLYQLNHLCLTFFYIIKDPCKDGSFSPFATILFLDRVVIILKEDWWLKQLLWQFTNRKTAPFWKKKHSRFLSIWLSYVFQNESLYNSEATWGRNLWQCSDGEEQWIRRAGGHQKVCVIMSSCSLNI